MSMLIEIPSLIICQLMSLYYLFYNLKLIGGPEVYIDLFKGLHRPFNPQQYICLAKMSPVTNYLPNALVKAKLYLGKNL